MRTQHGSLQQPPSLHGPQSSALRDGRHAGGPGPGKPPHTPVQGVPRRRQAQAELQQLPRAGFCRQRGRRQELRNSATETFRTRGLVGTGGQMRLPWKDMLPQSCTGDGETGRSQISSDTECRRGEGKEKHDDLACDSATLTDNAHLTSLSPLPPLNPELGRVAISGDDAGVR